MKTQSAKAKGRNLQKWWRDKLLDLLKNHGIVEADIKSTSMGAGGEDVQLSPAARKLLPISTECKSHAKMAVYTLYDQAVSNSGKDEPVLVVKANRRKPLVVVDADHYLSLWKEKLSGKKK